MWTPLVFTEMSTTPLFSISGATIPDGMALCIWTDQHKVHIVNVHSNSIHLFFISQPSIIKATVKFAVPSGTTAILNVHTYNWELGFNENNNNEWSKNRYAAEGSSIRHETRCLMWCDIWDTFCPYGTLIADWSQLQFIKAYRDHTSG